MQQTFFENLWLLSFYRELLSYIYSVFLANYMCSQWSSKQRIRLNLLISAFYPHFSVLSPFQRFIPYFNVLSPFRRFIPHFSVLSPFQFPLSVSVIAIRFQRFIPTRANLGKIRLKLSISIWKVLSQSC